MQPPGRLYKWERSDGGLLRAIGVCQGKREAHKHGGASETEVRID